MESQRVRHDLATEQQQLHLQLTGTQTAAFPIETMFTGSSVKYKTCLVHNVCATRQNWATVCNKQGLLGSPWTQDAAEPDFWSEQKRAQTADRSRPVSKAGGSTPGGRGGLGTAVGGPTSTGERSAREQEGASGPGDPDSKFRQSCRSWAEPPSKAAHAQSSSPSPPLTEHQRPAAPVQVEGNRRVIIKTLKITQMENKVSE